MAKFIFKMENILSIKLKLEEQEKANYALAIARLQRAEERLALLKQKQAAYEKQLTDLIHSTLDIIKIKQTENAIVLMKEAVLEQQKVVESEEKNVEVAGKRLTAAMKDRKTYERLKEKEFDKFLDELNKQEQKEIDELVSYKHGNSETSIEFNEE